MSVTKIALGILLASSLASPAFAQQLAPAPKKAPRTPVNSHLLQTAAKTIPTSRLLSGTAKVLDTERLLLQGFELRLFGIIPPKVNAPLGPQARDLLDVLAKSAVTCQIKDRKKNGDYLATCSNESNADFGIELLRRGLAVASRESLQSTTLIQPYLASERAAQKQRLGLWQNQIPEAASADSIKEAAEETFKAKKEVARLLAEKKAAEARSKSLREVTEQATKSIPPPSGDHPFAQPIIDHTEIAKIEELPVPEAKPAEPEPLVLSKEELNPTTIISLNPIKETSEAPVVPAAPTNWLEKNQFFATGLLFLFSSFVFAGNHLLWRRREAKNEVSSMAAALRGELMAARAICRARLNKWENMTEKTPAIWPRIRIIVFQAYLGKLGLLGADLSRQLASIYGQASDFASYYNQQKGGGDLGAKKQALQTLLDHIEEVLPRLGSVEETGTRPISQTKVAIRHSTLNHLPKKLISSAPSSAQTSLEKTARKKEPLQQNKKQTTIHLAEIKDEIMKDNHRHTEKDPTATPLQKQKNKIKDAMHAVRNHIGYAAEKATRRFVELQATPPSTEHYIPDYANLTEEEIAALSEDNYDDFVMGNHLKQTKIN